MAIKGRILSVIDVDMATGGEYETDVYMFKKKFLTAGLPEKTVEELILKKVEPYKEKFMQLGLTEKEAEDRIKELIEIESEPLPEEEE